jgi:hypothetical protein
MIYPDLIDVLLKQHDEIRRMCTAVQRAGGSDKQRLFEALERLVYVHEVGERHVARPAVRNSGPAGDEIGTACMLEEEGIERAVAELHDLTADHADFDDRFAVLRQALADHTAREERDEFPLLPRYVPVDRLHMMASELHDVQLMTAN